MDCDVYLNFDGDARSVGDGDNNFIKKMTPRQVDIAIILMVLFMFLLILVIVGIAI